MKGLNWNDIIMSPCLVSTLNEALLCVIRNRDSKRTIVDKTGYIKPWLNNTCVLVHRTKQRAYRVWSRSRAQADIEEYTESRRHAERVCGS